MFAFLTKKLGQPVNRCDCLPTVALIKNTAVLCARRAMRETADCGSKPLVLEGVGIIEDGPAEVVGGLKPDICSASVYAERFLSPVVGKFECLGGIPCDSEWASVFYCVEVDQAPHPAFTDVAENHVNGVAGMQ